MRYLQEEEDQGWLPSFLSRVLLFVPSVFHGLESLGANSNTVRSCGARLRELRTKWLAVSRLPTEV